jgi:hypothetical protein
MSRNTNTAIVGRPIVYRPNTNRDRHIAKLISNFSALTAQKILNAGSENDLRLHRNLDLIPESLGISYPTILKIARRHGLKLKVGRPSSQVSVNDAVA